MGGSTGSNFDSSATKEIREIATGTGNGFTGNWREVYRMRVARTEGFAILGGKDDLVVMIGGTEAPIIDVMNVNSYKPYCVNKLKRIENNTFAQLCNYTCDINLKPCAAG